MTEPKTMRAMVLEKPGQPLQWREVPMPQPGPEQVLLRVRACGVCRTDLHVVDGELPHPKLPLILGHEIVGTVAAAGSQVRQFRVGERLGVPWLGRTCGVCRYCREGRENLCDNPGFTGYTLDGGYAEYAVAHQNYSFPLPPAYGDAEAAPLLCAGLIGYRSYRMAKDAGARLGIYGFGAAAHITIQIALGTRGKRSMPSPGRGTPRPRNSPGGWGPCGPAAPTRGPRRNWTRPSFLRRWARSSPRP